MIYFTSFKPTLKDNRERIIFKSDSSVKELLDFEAKADEFQLHKNCCSFRIKASAKFGIVVENGCNLSPKFVETIEGFFSNVEYRTFDIWKKLVLISPKKESSSSNELLIRDKTKEYLESNYKMTHLQDEFTHTELNVRADLFGTTEDNKVITVEIKSDKDTFVRLEKQLDNYIKISHLVYVALDVEHIDKFLNKFHQYKYDSIGILFLENGKLHKYREARAKNDIYAQNLLWKDEYASFFRFWNCNKINKMASHTIKELIYRVFTVQEYKYLSELIFVNRYNHKNKILLTEKYIEDIDYKKIKTEKYFIELTRRKS